MAKSDHSNVYNIVTHLSLVGTKEGSKEGTLFI
jgi:hypothetical protein